MWERNENQVINTHQGSCGKVMFSVVCFSLSVCPEGSHVTITHDAWDLTVQRPPSCSNLFNFDLTVQEPPTLCPVYRVPLVVTSIGQDWRPVQTCSLEGPLVLTSGGNWSTYTRSASGRYASYWNAFFFSVLLTQYPVEIMKIYYCYTLTYGASLRRPRLAPLNVLHTKGPYGVK